jgi:hypothetical protein
MESRQDDILGVESLPPKLLNGNKKVDEDTPPDERSALLPKPNGEEQGDVYDLEDGDTSRWHLILLEFVRCP